MKVLDKKLLASCPRQRRHLAVRKLEIDEPARRDELPGTPQHGDGIFHMLQHLVEGDDVECSEVIDGHEVAEHGLDSNMLPHMADGTGVGIDRRAVPSCLFDRMGKHPETRTDIEQADLLPGFEMAGGERFHAGDPAGIVGSLRRQRYHPLERRPKTGIIAIGRVDIVTAVAGRDRHRMA